MNDDPGILSRAELDAAGMSRRAVDHAIRAGSLRRVRSGWYALRDLSADELTAATIGGRLSCLSAARMHGLWIPPTADRRPHVVVRDGAHVGLGAALIHRRAEEPPLRRVRDRLVVPPLLCLDTVARCQSAGIAIVVIESALERRVVSEDGWHGLLASLPARRRVALSGASALSGSGTESEFVRRIRRIGVSVRQQVQIRRDRVDVVLDDGTVVELDSARFHDALEDARRDARVGIAGHPTLRFRYEQVWFEWPAVEAAVLAARRRRAGRPDTG